MTADSDIRLSTPKEILSRNTVFSLRVPGLFGKWSALGWTMFLLGTLMFATLAYYVSTQGVAHWDMTVTKMMQASLKRIPESWIEDVIFGFYLGRELLLLSAVLFYGLLGYLLVPRMPSQFWKWFVILLLWAVTRQGWLGLYWFFY